MQSRLLFIAMALALGAILPMQAAINARLAKTAGSPVMAAFISFAVGTIALMIFLNYCRSVSNSDLFLLSHPGGSGQVVYWELFLLPELLYLLPRLGVVLSFSLVLAGQMFAAILFDQFGWLGVAVREISRR